MDLGVKTSRLGGRSVPNFFAPSGRALELEYLLVSLHFWESPTRNSFLYDGVQSTIDINVIGGNDCPGRVTTFSGAAPVLVPRSHLPSRLAPFSDNAEFT
jgi:hypothetical protein